MEWSNELALQLIDEYEKLPILWDAKHPFHFNRSKKLDAWEIIVNNMKINVAEVKQKMGSLLGSFRREKAKGKKSIGTRKACKDVYISKWFAFKRMHFLLDKDECRKTMDTENENNEEQEINESNLNSQQDLSNLDNQEDNIENEPPNESTVIENVSFTAPEPKQKERKLHDKKDDAKLEEAFKILKESAARKELPPDACTIYSQHVANKLRNYSTNTRIQVEHAINNILFVADMGKYNYPIPTSFPHNYENVPASNYSPTHFYNNNQVISTPLPSPTFSNASTSSISNCPTPMLDFNMESDKDFEHL